jgi:RimJ/RimL family protein N-acetyltransferase
MTFCDTSPAKEEVVRLRPMELGDLEALFAMHVDPASNAMAVTIPRTQEAFYDHWHRSLQQDNITPRAILLDETFVGCISCFLIDGRMSLGYWIDRKHWGKGIATRAVKLILSEFDVRPIHATAATSNGASMRILEKSGFQLVSVRFAPATDRFPACEEASFRLD